MDTDRLVRALVVGAVLGFAAVGLFLLLFLVVLAGASDTVRLFVSFFVPIFTLGLIVGGYYVITRKKKR